MNAIMFSLLSVSIILNSQEEKMGDFEGHTDIGLVKIKGDAEFNPDAKQYTITGSGENMWAGEDAFHFLCARLPAIRSWLRP